MALDEFQKAMKRVRYHYARSEEVLDKIRRGPRIDHTGCRCSWCRYLKSKYARLWDEYDRYKNRVARELGKALDAAGWSDRRADLVFRFSRAVCIGIKQK